MKKASKTTKPPLPEWACSIRSTLILMANENTWNEDTIRKALDESGSRRTSGRVHLGELRAYLKSNGRRLFAEEQRHRIAMRAYMAGHQL